MSNEISITINGVPLDISGGGFNPDLTFHATSEHQLRHAIESILAIPGDRIDTDEVEGAGSTVWFRNDIELEGIYSLSMTVFGYDGLTVDELKDIVQEVAQKPERIQLTLSGAAIESIQRQIDYTYELADGDSNDDEIQGLQDARDMLANLINYTPKEAS